MRYHDIQRKFNHDDRSVEFCNVVVVAMVEGGQREGRIKKALTWRTQATLDRMKVIHKCR